MLVLTRRTSEKLVIGDNIVITIVRIDGGQVRVGIEAPREVSVRRAELKLGKLASNQAVSESAFPIPILNQQTG